MTNLNAVNIGMNKFCGPAVLSILTGKSTDECANVITSVNGNYKVEGVYLKDLLKAADILGFDNQEKEPWGSTLFASLTKLSMEGDGMYIVSVPHHFVAIEVKEKKIFFCDNHTKVPMPAASSARLLQRVKAINKVFKRRKPQLLDWYVTVSKTNTSDGKIVVSFSKVYVYDMDEQNTTVKAGSFTIASQANLDAIIEALKA